MKRIAIIHFNPVERYPPTVNWLNYLGAEGRGEWGVRVFTTRPDAGVHQYFNPPVKFIQLRRMAVVNKKQPSFIRYFNYLLFYSRTLINMIQWRPDVVMYYETQSGLPALLYTKYFNRQAKLFVHYHEYMSDREYNESIPLSKWPHKLEKKWYPTFDWISHTNEDRMRMFREENGNVRVGQVNILPNYPPGSWADGKAVKGGAALKFVYVGAVDLTSMYTIEFASWIAGLGGTAQWDIYSSNITDEAMQYLSDLPSGHVKFKGSVEYAALPAVLRAYDVGVVLYRGTTLNYRYNVPNKVYEYWACGLDVWFPEEMDSCHAVVTKGVFPRVSAVNFGCLDRVDAAGMMSRRGLQYAASPFYAEGVLQDLWQKINLQKGKIKRRSNK